MKLVGLSEMKASLKHWVAGIVNNLVLGYVLALMVLNLGTETIGQAINYCCSFTVDWFYAGWYV